MTNLRRGVIAILVASSWCVATTFPPLGRTDTPASDSATDNRLPADRAMADRVYSALTADQTNYYRHVTVRADQGVITLGGFVADEAAQAKARKIAQAVSGVTRVVDQIQLQPKGRSGGEE